ncbi:MAG: hypothetical protein R3F59_06080 [Myxococcota bacterium]
MSCRPIALVVLLLGCKDDPEPTVHDTGVDVGVAGVGAEVVVDGEVAFSGHADAPAMGLYQPPREGANCLAARRVGVIQGRDVWVDLVFPGEFPAPGAEVRFPARPDSDAADWTAATWVGDDGGPWAAYGGLARLDAFADDLVQMTLTDATVCRSDRIGQLDPAIDGTWSVHVSDCQAASEVVFRTTEPLPFDLSRPPWCARGRAHSWMTRDAEPLCSELSEPCEPEAR